jgi:hypothetical protein
MQDQRLTIVSKIDKKEKEQANQDSQLDAKIRETRKAINAKQAQIDS